MERKHAMKNLFVLTAVIEGGAGLVFFLLPSIAATLLFGSPLHAPVAFMVTRLTGAALITLGVACWLARLDPESRAAAGLVAAMLFYNLAALAILAYAGFGLGLVGATLLLGVGLHSAMAVWCFRCLRMRKVTTESKTY
jgi:hypothetical protein